MICPKCRNVALREHKSIIGWIFKTKTLTVFCPLCKFERTREFKISREDYELEKLRIANKPTEKIFKYIKVPNNVIRLNDHDEQISGGEYD